MKILVVSAHSFEIRAVAGALPNCIKVPGAGIYQNGDVILATIGQGKASVLRRRAST